MVYSTQTSGVYNNYSAIPTPGIQACWNICACKLKVEGTGRIMVQPDMAVVVLGVFTENMQLKLAQDENTSIMTAVLRTLREMGISPEDIKTQSYTITPQYEYVEANQVFRGYRVEHLLEVTIRNMNKIGEIIDAVVQNGANLVNSIRFTISDQSMYYRQALNAAVDDALAKARTLGSKLNIEVSRVPVRIIELGYEAGPIVPLMVQATGAAVPVQSGRIEVSARIETVFDYMPIHS